MVGFHFGGAQQDEEEPVERQHISRAALSCPGDASLAGGGDHGDVGMLGMVAGQALGASATLKVWSGAEEKTHLQCLLPLHGNLTETMGHQDPGWITRVCRNPYWEVWGDRSLGQRRRILSWGCLWHHFPGNVARRQDAGVLGKENLPAARAAGLTGLWGHGRRLERELRALDKTW